MDNFSSLRIVGYEMPPFLTFVRQGSNIEFIGRGAYLLKRVLRAAKISYTFMESPNATHGIELSSGNTTGIMKILYENEADMSVMPYSTSLIRIKYLDFSTPFYYSTYTTLSGSPRGFIVESCTLLDIFQYQVWILLVIIMVLISGIVRISYQLEKQNRSNWSYYFLTFFGSLMGQEFPLRIYFGNKARATIFLFWVIGAFCLSSAFQAVLLSFVTIREKPDRIDSAEDIVKYPNVKPLVLRDSNDGLSIKNNKNPKLAQLWRQIEHHKGEVNFRELFKPDNLKETSRGLAVILGEISLLRIILNRGCVPGSHFYIAQNPFLQSTISWAMRKGLPYSFKLSLTKKLSLHATTHQTQHFYRRRTLRAETCLDSAETPEITNLEIPLSYENLKHAFWCWLFGLVISCFLIAYELLIFQLQN